MEELLAADFVFRPTWNSRLLCSKCFRLTKIENTVAVYLATNENFLEATPQFQRQTKTYLCFNQFTRCATAESLDQFPESLLQQRGVPHPPYQRHHCAQTAGESPKRKQDALLPAGERLPRTANAHQVHRVLRVGTSLRADCK